MDIVGEAHHIGKLGIRHYGVVLPSPVILPAVIEIDIAPAVLVKPQVYEGLGHRLRVFLADSVPEAVPAAPAHWRSEQELVLSYLQAQRLAVAAQTVGRRQGDIVAACLPGPAADDACLRVEFQPLGQALGGEGHRTLAACRDLEEKIDVWALSVHARAVYAWRGGSLRRKYIFRIVGGLSHAGDRNGDKCRNESRNGAQIFHNNDVYCAIYELYGRKTMP